MNDMQKDWNKSLQTLLAKRAQRPPTFEYDPIGHERLDVVMSDGSTVPRENGDGTSRTSRKWRETVIAKSDGGASIPPDPVSLQRQSSPDEASKNGNPKKMAPDPQVGSASGACLAAPITTPVVSTSGAAILDLKESSGIRPGGSILPADAAGQIPGGRILPANNAAAINIDRGDQRIADNNNKDNNARPTASPGIPPTIASDTLVPQSIAGAPNIDGCGPPHGAGRDADNGHSGDKTRWVTWRWV